MKSNSQLDASAVNALKRWEAQQEGQLPGFFIYYSELMRIQNEVQCHINIDNPVFNANQVNDNLRAGEMALKCEAIDWNWRQVVEVFKQVLAWSERGFEGQREGNERLLKIADDRETFCNLVKDWYKGDALTEPTIRAADKELVASIFGITLKPFLAAYAKNLVPLIDQELWRRRHCPVCGGKPDFAYLSKENGARWLICSRCDAEWLYLRLDCPYCENQEHSSSEYFAGDSETNPYRIYVCDFCHQYIKAIDLRLNADEVFWSVERVKTLCLDIYAQEEGYKPG